MIVPLSPHGIVATLRRWLDLVTAAQVLFPVIAVLVLTIVWGATVNLIRVERANTEQGAAASILELANTYEAQMLRNMREIDYAMRVVKHAYESNGSQGLFPTLRNKGLLPPDFLFAMRLLDAQGQVIATTRAGEKPAEGGYKFSQQQASSELWIGQPRRDAKSGEWKLDFSRSLQSANGAFAGVVMLSVDASYFVSGYERSKLGAGGVLGLVGTEDGMFRIRRTGEAVFSGDALGNPTMLANVTTQEAVVARIVNQWDGIRRFTAIKQLYAFPLTLVVGISEQEQLAATLEKTLDYVVRAIIASVLLMIFIATLGRVSWKLAQTAKRESQAKLEHADRVQYLAYHDALTGLPNRHYFNKMLEQSIHLAQRQDKSLAVLFLDLDRFKQINDTLGHQAGDSILAEIATRLKTSIRSSDMVARLGGDEFVVLLLDFDIKRYATTVAQKLLKVIAVSLPVHGQTLIGTTSIGISVYPEDAHDGEALMQHADAAMYHAKAQGKNNFQFYSEQLQVNSLRKLKLETGLRQALERSELQLHYQPKIDLRTTRMTGMEALLRWKSPEHGVVSPADFIPIAEDTGLIVPIGKWVLETACAQNVAWQKQGFPPMCVAVNLSGRQFGDERLMDDITEILNRSRLDPRYLELEITESMLMYDVEQAIRTLAALSEMGIRIAIDDFGTGYSSLSNLKRFPLNTLKIDRSFVTSLPHDAEGRAIAEAIINMSKALSLNIVAEGVETKEQANFLLEHGCDQCQGYYFGKPVPAEEFQVLLDLSSQDGRDYHAVSGQPALGAT